MSKYVRVNGMLYVRTDSKKADGWKAKAKEAYNSLLDLWLIDEGPMRRSMNSHPEKLQEVFSIYIGDLLEAEPDIIDWQKVYDDLHKDHDPKRG